MNRVSDGTHTAVYWGNDLYKSFYYAFFYLIKLALFEIPVYV